MEASAASSTGISGFGLGLGLGLPTSLMQERRAPRMSEELDHEMKSSNTLLFPLPAGSRRVSSISSQRQGDLVSYWSPATEVNADEFDDASDLADSDEEYDEGTDEEIDVADISIHELNALNIDKVSLLDQIEAMSPISLVPHAGLKALSPKLETLARATSSPGELADEAIASALEWAWLVPMVDTTMPQMLASQPPVTSGPHMTRTKTASPRAPSMSHMPSIASICSDLSFGSSAGESNPSVATSSYQSDMLRSHSLLSSFSLDSISTAATSAVASSSQSVMQRKRPVPSRARVIKRGEGDVIRLAGRRCCDARRAGDSQAASLTRKNTKASIISYKASIHTASPLFEDMDDMIFEPMHQLPSPQLSQSEIEETGYWHSSAPEEVPAFNASPLQATQGRETLMAIWQAAEAAESRRRVLRKECKPARAKAAKTDIQTPNIRSWMSRVKKSASFSNLKARMVEEELTVDDPAVVSDVQMSSCVDVEAAVQAFLEPRPYVAGKVSGIEQVFLAQRQDECLDYAHRKPGSSALWNFLG